MTEKLNQEALAEPEIIRNARKWAAGPRADLAVVADVLVTQLIDAWASASASLAERTRERDEARARAQSHKEHAQSLLDDNVNYHSRCARIAEASDARADAAEARVKVLTEATKSVLASLVAITSIVIRAEDIKKQPSKAVASDVMFRQMLVDFDKATSEARAALASSDAARGVDHSSTPLAIASARPAPGHVMEFDSAEALIAHIEGRQPASSDAAPEKDDALAVLSELSSYVGAGLGDEKTTAAQYSRRIRWGITHHANASIRRCATVVDDLSRRPQTTWGEVKRAILDLMDRPASDVAPESKEGE